MRFTEICLESEIYYLNSAISLLHVNSATSLLYALKAASFFVAIMLVALSRVRAYHPFPRFGPANQVTTVRALFVALVAAGIGEAPTPSVAATAVAASTIATVLDGADGWLARRTRMESAFGARFDMEVDALLIQVLAVLAWRWGKAGPWVLVSGLLRYLFLLSGWLWPWMQRRLQPTARGKTICILQIVTLTIALVPIVRPTAGALLAGLGLLALCYSFLVDSLWLWAHRLEA
jgi:phosphatidylglycerophosphate synthase